MTSIAIFFDQPVQVNVDQAHAGMRTPVTEQSKLCVFRLQWLFKERVIPQIDHSKTELEVNNLDYPNSAKNTSAAMARRNRTSRWASNVVANRPHAAPVFARGELGGSGERCWRSRRREMLRATSPPDRGRVHRGRARGSDRTPEERLQGSRSHPGHRLRGNQHIDGSDKNTRERGFIEQAQSTIEAPSRDAAAEDSLPAGSQIGIFIPRSDDAERARGTSLRCSLDIWRGSPVMIYTPKVATGFSPGVSTLRTLKMNEFVLKGRELI